MTTNNKTKEDIKYSRKISELQRDKEDKTAKNKNNVEMINRATSEIMNNYEEKIQQMHDDHRFNMDENARKQTEKEEVDNQRLMDLQAEME